MLTKWNKQKGLVKNFRIAPTRFFWNILSTVLDLVLDLLVCRWNETFCNQSRRTISDLPQKLYIYRRNRENTIFVHTFLSYFHYGPYFLFLSLLVLILKNTFHFGPTVIVYNKNIWNALLAYRAPTWPLK